MFFKVRHYQKQTKYYLTDKAKKAIYVVGVISAFLGVWFLGGLVFRYDINIPEIVQNYISTII